jgi:hypothetical protein
MPSISPGGSISGVTPSADSSDATTVCLVIGGRDTASIRLQASSDSGGDLVLAVRSMDSDYLIDGDDDSGVGSDPDLWIDLSPGFYRVLIWEYDDRVVDFRLVAQER